MSAVAVCSCSRSLPQPRPRIHSCSRCVCSAREWPKQIARGQILSLRTVQHVSIMASNNNRNKRSNNNNNTNNRRSNNWHNNLANDIKLLVFCLGYFTHSATYSAGQVNRHTVRHIDPSLITIYANVLIYHVLSALEEVNRFAFVALLPISRKAAKSARQRQRQKLKATLSAPVQAQLDSNSDCDWNWDCVCCAFTLPNGQDWRLD